MCDLLDGMEEGRALRPLAFPARSTFSLHSPLDPPTPSTLEAEILKRTKRASQRPNTQFYKEALEFLSSVSTESAAVLQITDENSLKVGRMNSVVVKEERSFTGVTWITPSGSVKKSFKSCLESTDPSRRYIDLSAFPPCLRPCPLKEELNDEFAEKYPFLSRRLTLSKILSLRDNLIQTVAVRMEIDPMIVAVAWVHFERLLCMNVLTKSNRKMYSAACVLLTYKLYGEMQLSTARAQINTLIGNLCSLDQSSHLTPKLIKECEFDVYSALSFNLVLTVEDVQQTYDTIVKRMERLRGA